MAREQGGFSKLHFSCSANSRRDITEAKLPNLWERAWGGQGLRGSVGLIPSSPGVVPEP